MKTTILKSNGSTLLEKSDSKQEFCVTSIEKGATVYSYFTSETEAFEHYLSKVKKSQQING